MDQLFRSRSKGVQHKNHRLCDKIINLTSLKFNGIFLPFLLQTTWIGLEEHDILHYKEMVFDLGRESSPLHRLYDLVPQYTETAV